MECSRYQVRMGKGALYTMRIEIKNFFRWGGAMSRGLFPFFLLLFFSLTASAAEEVGAIGCQVSAKTPVLVCEEGGAFLCVNTPPGGVKEKFVILRGRLNLESSSLGQFSVSAQHEYTKEIAHLSLSEPRETHCWEEDPTSEINFCLETTGKYSVYVPLPELGPYILFVTASRFQGKSMQRRVRVSSVIAPTVTEDIVRYEPDIMTGTIPEGTNHVRVILDLLDDCGESRENCDFIGASTGGVFVTVTNQMGLPTRNVVCETNNTQGGAGRFVIGVPTLPGPNQLAIVICNAVTGLDPTHCPRITPKVFQVEGSPARIEIWTPSPTSPFLWDASQDSFVPLQFRVGGYHPKECDNSVTASINVGKETVLCPDLQGMYSAKLRPKRGYNVVTITAQLPTEKLLETVAFGWGEALSPFDVIGKVKPEGDWRLHEALRLGFSKTWINETLRPKVNDLLSRDDFGEWLTEFTTPKETEEKNIEEAVEEEKRAIREALGYCPKGGGMRSLKIQVLEKPNIGFIEVAPILFQEDRLEATIQARDVSVLIQLVKDKNGDGTPDIDPMPLRLGFKTLTLHPILEPITLSGKTVWKLSSSHTDCSYKREGACLKMPALLTPALFEGNANRAGSFVVCDGRYTESAHIKEVCLAFNKVDRQTRGAVQEKILDALNGSYACGGTVALTQMFEKGMKVEKEEDLFAFRGTLGLDAIQISPAGLVASFFSRFGEPENFEQWPEAIRQRQPGILIANRGGRSDFLSSGSNGISLDLSLPMLSQLFWGLSHPEEEEFSITLDQEFFRDQLEFDFEEKCEIPKPDDLCKIYPRTQEILGTTVTDYGYLDPKDPVRLTLTPSKAFPLRLSALEPEGKVLLEVADWILGIEAKGDKLIDAKLGIQLVAEVSLPELTTQDPDHFEIILKPLVQESRIWLTPIPETNRTIIPGTLLLSDLKQKVESYLFSAEKEFRIPIKRFFDFPENSLIRKMGLQELTWGHNGFELSWDASGDRLQFNLMPVLR